MFFIHGKTEAHKNVDGSTLFFLLKIPMNLFIVEYDFSLIHTSKSSRLLKQLIYENELWKHDYEIVGCQQPLCFAITLDFVAKMAKRVSVMLFPSKSFTTIHSNNTQALPYTWLFIN